ncbi:hypothetical protein EG328_001767 [Venturia inaequalis]|uniref:Uncharacterized protein n=1 Tax=Venturia inaequalis TaxID=5025 RepID=A0A8H3UWE1_VENIN|nr:hypothetical protein EG328_001767 [Venturia inaequalis]KAE9991427.1 hypothetical protein EG327_011656 [Venturia inaequalis]
MGLVSSATLSLVFLLSSLASAQTGTPTPEEPASTTVSCDRFHKTGFWDIDIDNWPALAPECGPPLSINSLRDRSKLPVQICAIIAAYLLFIVVIGILLVTVGKRSRNKAQGFVEKLPKYEIEMVKQEYPHKNFEPLSPAYSQKSWMRAPFRGFRSSALSKASSFAGSPIEAPSPAVASINSFDNQTDAQNRESRQAELERLYAAVMAHEDAKRSTGQLSLAPSLKATDSIAPNPPAQSVPIISLPQSPRDSRRNLRVQITPAEPQHFEQQSKSSYRAIYPPSEDGQSMQDASPMTPITPRRAGNYIPPRQTDMWPLPSPTTPGPGPMSAAMRIELPNDMYPASPAPRPVQMQLPPPPPPPPAQERQSSSSGSGRSRKLGLKNLRISAPLQKDEFSDRQPLTPRTFTPAAPPPPPAYGVRFQEPQLSATSMESYTSERMDEPQPLRLPTGQPQRRPPNLTLTLPPGPNSTKPASSSANTLPLRAFQNASTENINPASPGIIKTTYLEKKLEKVGRGPQTGRTPRTGVPPTPYSAYMPFTPITPVTPGLVSRKERKERIKAEGRKVLLEEDEVKDDEDMWDAGY